MQKATTNIDPGAAQPEQPDKGRGNRSSGGCALWLLYPLFGVALLVAIPAYRLYISLQIDDHGTEVQCVVSSKEERIDFDYDSWSRSNRLTVKCPWRGVNAPLIVTISVDENTYDAYHVGSPLSLRYLEHHPLEGLGLKEYRLQGQLDWARRITSPQFLAVIPLIIILILVIAFAIWRFKTARWFLVAIALTSLLVWGLIPQSVPTPTGEQRTGEATVTDVHHITQILEGDESSGVTALQPYDAVTLKFVPSGWTDAVVTVDQVDTGSLPDLKVGSTVGISYSIEHPRNVVILNATHTYYRKNILGLVVGAVVWILAVFLFIMLASLVRRFKPISRILANRKRKMGE
jgi:hypothetical protein